MKKKNKKNKKYYNGLLDYQNLNFQTKMNNPLLEITIEVSILPNNNSKLFIYIS